MSKPLSALARYHPLLPLTKAPANDDAIGKTDSNRRTRSEADIMAARCGQQAKRLQPHWPTLLTHLSRLGPTLFVTRHGNTSHEKLLHLYKIALSGNVASIHDQDGSLELDLSHWHCGFALHEGDDPHSACISLHFFDIHGKLLHSIYPMLSSMELGTAFLNKLYSADQTPQEFLLPPTQLRRRSRATVDTASLTVHWRHLQNCQAIPVILQKHQVSRLQALQALPPEFATPAARTAFQTLMQQTVERNMPVELSLFNPGVRQTHRGLLENHRGDGFANRSHDAWFRLNLDSLDLHSAWVVHKPTANGMVSSLELYNHHGEPVLMLSDMPNAGLPQTLEWQSLLYNLTTATAA